MSTPLERAEQPAPLDRAAILREGANALASLGPEDSLVSGPKAWNEAIEVLRRMADEAPQSEAQGAADEDDDELVCVDECGSCDACGMEVFGTPAEGWREAARFLRRTARQSADRQGAVHGARLIEAELRRMAAAVPQPDKEA